jgi:hypothetical protein
MESSKFIQLSEGILVEYVYTNQANPTVFNTATFPIEILRDAYTGGSYMFNTDSVAATMGNYRDISAVPINAAKNQYVYLDTSVGVPYNDFDPNLTPSANLLQTTNLPSFRAGAITFSTNCALADKKAKTSALATG